jgi:hypothetical protein
LVPARKRTADRLDGANPVADFTRRLDEAGTLALTAVKEPKATAS